MESLIFKRPLVFAAAFVIVFDALFLGSGFIAARLAPSAPSYMLTDVSEVIGLTLSIVFLARLHWLRRVGFNGRRDWRDLRVLWLPVAIGALLLVAAITPARQASNYLAVSLVLSSVLIGFSEESAIRGVVLQSLIKLGSRKAIVLSALFFGLLHFNNLIQAGVSGSLQSTSVAAIFAFLVGVGLGAFRLRTNTIWPVIAFHSVSDIPGLFVLNTYGYSTAFNLPTALLEISLGAMLALYGLFLIRNPSRLSAA